jgi:hypothetical protein
MNRVHLLKERWRGLVEIGRRAWAADEAETVVDVLDAMERIERQDLPRARALTRAEHDALKAARREDPDAPRLRIADDAPGGWVADPEHRARMSPALLDKIEEQDRRDHDQAERAAAENLALRQAELLERWRSDVLDGLADPRAVPPDFDATPDMVAAGKVTVAEVEEAIAERVAAFHGVQLQEDKKLDAAILDYGRMCAEVFGADGHEALRALLGGPERVGAARFGREEGWG